MACRNRTSSSPPAGRSPFRRRSSCRRRRTHCPILRRPRARSSPWFSGTLCDSGRHAVTCACAPCAGYSTPGRSEMPTSFHATAAVAAAAFLLVQPTLAQAPSAAATGIKYMRDSEEYASLSRQVYRQAAEAVGRRAQGLPSGSWAVVLDIDETALDNSTYELD